MVADNKKNIGGEFEIEPNWLNPSKNALFSKFELYSSGRAALFSILNHIVRTNSNIKTLYLPDYLCDSIIDASIRSGIKVDFYSLNSKFLIDRGRCQFPVKEAFAVLSVNYFGLCKIDDEISWIKDNFPQAIVIADNVQAFFSMRGESLADYCYTSFRKTFPTPDGAWVIDKLNNLTNEEVKFSPFVYNKLLGGVIKNAKNANQIDDSVYLDFFSKGEHALESDYSNIAVSPYSLNILDKLNFDDIRAKRIENAKYLSEKLSKIGIYSVMDIEHGDVPLFLPIVIENRDDLRERLFANNIFCPIHWPLNKQFAKRLILGEKMAKSSISLIIDQRYSIEDMDRIYKVIANF